MNMDSLDWLSSDLFWQGAFLAVCVFGVLVIWIAKRGNRR